jgi:cytochrome c oxidase subunit IV
MSAAPAHPHADATHHPAEGHGHAGDSHSGGSHHVVPDRVFAMVFGALLVLTVLTVGISRFDFGGLNLLIAMAVAAVKAALVMTFFMHLKYDTATNNIVFLSSFLFLALLFLFTLSDVATRGDADPELEIRAPVRDVLRQIR